MVKKNSTSVLIAGAGGLLGSRFYEYFLSEGYVVGGIYRNKSKTVPKHFYRIDLVNDDLNEIGIGNYDVLLNCVGFADVDQNEKFPEKSWLENVSATVALANFAKSRNMKLIHFSTDHFDSERPEMRSEKVEMIPVNQYGFTKLEAEKMVLEIYPSALVIRTNFFGAGLDKNGSLFDWAVSQINLKKELFGYTNIVFNPVSIKFLCKAVVALMQESHSGVLNVSGNSDLSKFDFIKLIISSMGADSTLLKKGEYSSQSEASAKRPNFMSLSPTKFQTLTSLEIPIYSDMINQELMVKSQRAN